MAAKMSSGKKAASGAAKKGAKRPAKRPTKAVSGAAKKPAKRPAKAAGTGRKAKNPKAAKKGPKRPAKAAKARKRAPPDSFDSGLVIVDEDIKMDKERINEERRAYLEEARSQDSSE